ncbi:OmpA family protein [Azospirillum sp.]|uniref:OmpA family protein n=1 Tax=Azospirillum sp. TaxID=34012 RepID=UPI003D71CBE0
MRAGWWMAVLLAPTGAWAAEAPAVMLGTNPSECQIARALLGSAPPGCPPALVVMPASPAAPVEPPPAPVPPPVVVAPAAPAPATVVERTAAFLINFDFGSARIRPESQAVLDRVAAVMAAPGAETVRFRIVGHTDDVGSDAGNLELSRRRAAAVKDYLVRVRRIAAARLDAAGMGKRALIDQANPRSPENRRVEIVALQVNG